MSNSFVKTITSLCEHVELPMFQISSLCFSLSLFCWWQTITETIQITAVCLLISTNTQWKWFQWNNPNRRQNHTSCYKIFLQYWFLEQLKILLHNIAKSKAKNKYSLRRLSIPFLISWAKFNLFLSGILDSRHIRDLTINIKSTKKKTINA